MIGDVVLVGHEQQPDAPYGHGVDDRSVVGPIAVSDAAPGHLYFPVEIQPARAGAPALRPVGVDVTVDGQAVGDDDEAVSLGHAPP